MQIVIEDELTQVLQERNGANVPVTGRQIANYWVDPADGLKHGYLNYVDALKQSEQGVQPPFQRVPNWLTPEIIKEHTQEIARQMSQDIKNVSAQTVEELGQALVSSLNESNSIEDLVYYTLFEVLEEKKRKKKRKLTAKPSSETSLRDWFGRKGAKGKKGGWVDCNTCRKDKKTGRKKCSACGRSGGEKRSKYPSCRPTLQERAEKEANGVKNPREVRKDDNKT